jgi:actin-related protein
MDTSTLVHEINGETSKTGDPNRINKRYLLDPMSYRAPRPNMHVQPFLKDGLVNDWDLFEKMLDYTFLKYLRCDTTHHPILFSEPVVCREDLAHVVFWYSSMENKLKKKQIYLILFK